MTEKETAKPQEKAGAKQSAARDRAGAYDSLTQLVKRYLHMGDRKSAVKAVQEWLDEGFITPATAQRIAGENKLPPVKAAADETAVKPQGEGIDSPERTAKAENGRLEAVDKAGTKIRNNAKNILDAARYFGVDPRVVAGVIYAEQSMNVDLRDGLDGQPWCDMFISYCADQAGLLDNLVPRFASVNSGIKWYEDHERYQSSGSGYAPKAGDIIFFESNGQKHTGIVTAYDPNTYTVYTVEGNSDNSVAGRKYDRSNSKIIGYGTNGGNYNGSIPDSATNGSGANTR